MNAVYNSAAYRMLTATFNWLAMDLVLSAWNGIPLFDPTHQLISNVKAAGFTELGSSLPVTLTSVAANGVAQTNNIVIPAIPIGADVTWFTMSQRGVAHDSSTLLLFIDEALALPYTPNGLDLVVTPDWFSQRGWFRP